MSRPTKDQAEWIALAVFMIIVLVFAIARDGWVEAAEKALACALIILSLYALLALARRFGR